MTTYTPRAFCRYCEKLLLGKAYHLGGVAYIPDANGRPGRQAPRNYYGGYVCSERCDRMACMELEQSMPGHGWGQQPSLDAAAEARVRSNWETAA